MSCSQPPSARRSVRRSIWALLALLALPPRGHATTVAPMDVRTLSQRADAVVVARCVDVTSGVDPLTHRLGTVGRFVVDEVVKGAGVAGEVSVALPGGVAGREAAPVAGVPRLERGLAAVLFLTAPRADGARGVLGMDQGAFEITHASDGARVRGAAGEASSGASSARAGTKPLAEFLDEVRSHLR
ncbi:MAG: hypothetical protein U0610_09600 [bacterium]